MSEKLKPCPFCPIGTRIINPRENTLACSNCGVEMEGETWELTVKQWNTRAPIYTPVKPEDVTEGYYWAVLHGGPPPGIIKVEIDGGELRFGECFQENYCDLVSTLLEEGWKLYRISDLEVAGDGK